MAKGVVTHATGSHLTDEQILSPRYENVWKSERCPKVSHPSGVSCIQFGATSENSGRSLDPVIDCRGFCRLRLETLQNTKCRALFGVEVQANYLVFAISKLRNML